MLRWLGTKSKYNRSSLLLITWMSNSFYNSFVVTMCVTNYNIHYVLVDSESLVNIIFRVAYNQMRLGLDQLKPVYTPLYGFLGSKIILDSFFTLPFTTSEYSNDSTMMRTYLIVMMPSIFNAILSRHALKVLQAMLSTCHLL